MFMKNINNPMPEHISPTRRPISITLLAGVCFLTMIYTVYLVYDAWAYAQSLPGGLLDAGVRTDFIRAVLLVPVLGVLTVGVWQLRWWARTLAMALLVIAIGSIFVDGFLRYPIRVALLLGVNRIVIPCALLLYLLHPATKAVFRPRR